VISFLVAAVEDAAEISALTRHVIRFVNAKDYTQQEVEHACTKFSPEYFGSKLTSRIFYKATLGQEMVGQGSFGEGKIHTLFVHPKFQGQGIGAKLLDKLEIAAFGSGIYEISLSSSVAAKGFYEKFGYSSLGAENSPAGVTYFMKKRLLQNH
jgi:putative acetyltransferase